MARSTKSIDNLTIDISANAQQASKALDSLISGITNLSNALNGINTKAFTNDIKALGGAVKGINMSPLEKSMSKLSKSMANYAKNSIRVASANRSISSGFASFKHGLDNLSNGLFRINTKINDFAARFKKADKVTKNFAQTVGLLYARFFLLIRGAKGLISAVKSSMNYIEVLNYFDASFGQVAERGVDKWSQMGYDSAEAYYNSFAERAKKVTGDMSGFFPEKDGTLTPTGMKSLGMNPQQMMQYQSQFAQMASSMGTTSEQALKLSEVLTKIGADLASVKNMEFEDVWRDMASGLVGMSRTLDKYGANIRNSNMEMKLHELGINANVKSLSQADKALLRTIILLDSATYAWGDLAETLNTPANQFRMLTNNIKLLGQMIGNIFLPIVAKILPYLNAFVIALQRLFTWLAKVLGIDLSGLLGKNTGYDNSNLSDLLDDAEDLSGALDDDTDSAKKLKKQLQGFDALNNLTTNEDKDKGKDSALTSGLLNDAFLDAVDKYLKAWQDAYDQIANKAEQIADKIARFFKRLAKPIFNAWKKVGDLVVQKWKNAGYNLKLLFKQIGKDFWRVWEQPKTQKIFEDILQIFGNIGEVVWHLANRFREAWVAGDSGFRILQGIRDIIESISDRARGMSESMVKWAKSLNLKPLLSKMADFVETLNPVIRTLMNILKDFLDQVLLPLAKWTLEEGLPNLIQVFIDFFKKVPWAKLRARLSEFWKHLEPFAKKVGQGLIIFIERITDAIARFVKSERFEKFLNWLEKKMDGSTPESIADALELIAKAIIGLKIAVKGFALLGGAVAVVKTFLDIFKGVGAIGAGVNNLSKIIPVFRSLGGIGGMLTEDIGLILGSGTWAEIGVTIGTGILGGIIAAIGGFKFGKWLGKLITDDDSWYDSFKWTGEGGFFDSFKYFLTDMLFNTGQGEISRFSNETLQQFEFFKLKLSEFWEDQKNQTTTQVEAIKSKLSEFWTSQKTQTETQLQWIRDWRDNKVKPLFSKESWFVTTGGMPEGFKQSLDELKQKYEQSSFKKWIDEKVKPLFTTEYWKGIFSNMVIGFSLNNTDILTKFQNLQNNITRIVNNIVNALAKITGAITNTTNKLKQLGHTPIRTQLSFPKATLHANGGFPEDGLFFANHNELVGKFENGKTAVANNEQIVSGIQNGVYGAMSESNALLMEQNALLQAILEKETGINANDIFRSVQRSASNYSKQYGKPAFS